MTSPDKRAIGLNIGRGLSVGNPVALIEGALRRYEGLAGSTVAAVTWLSGEPGISRRGEPGSQGTR